MTTVESRPKPKFGAAFAMVGVLLVAYVGLGLNFLPSDVVSNSFSLDVLLWVGLAIHVAVILFSAYRGVLRPFCARTSKFSLVAMLLIAPMLYAGIIWSIMLKVLPWSCAKIFGEEGVVETTVETYREINTRNCHYRIRGGAVKAIGYMCLDEWKYEMHPDRKIVVRLHGRRIAMGLAVSSIEIVRDENRP